MNDLFDGFVNLKMSSKQFVEQYDNTLKRRLKKNLWQMKALFSNSSLCNYFLDGETSSRGVHAIQV